MTRFLFKLGLCVPVVLVMGGINWLVDPGRFFVGQLFDLSRNRIEAAVVDDLRAGRPHLMASVYSERLVIEQILRDRRKIDVIVLGSSIAKPISGELFAGRSFFNASIYGGDLEEMVSAYELAWECGIRPKHVVLQFQGFGRMLGKRLGEIGGGFDAAFARAKKRLDLTDIEDDSMGMAYYLEQEPAGQFGIQGGWLHPYDKLISPRYLQLSLRNLMDPTPNNQIEASESENASTRFDGDNRRTIYADGSVQWSPRFRARNPATIRREFQDILKNVTASDLPFLNRDRCKLFETFILDMQQAGTQVDIVLTPPISWFFECVQGEYRSANKPNPAQLTEDYIRAFAKKNHVSVLGSFDPRHAGVTDADYVDYAHLRREAIGRLFKSSAPRP